MSSAPGLSWPAGPAPCHLQVSSESKALASLKENKGSVEGKLKEALGKVSWAQCLG